MTPNILKEAEGISSSFFQKLGSDLRPLKQRAVLNWAEKTVTSYPQLKGAVKVMGIDRLFGPKAYPPEAEVQAKMDAVKATAARRHAESHRLHLWFLAASAGSVAVIALYGYLQDSGILNSADVSAIDNQPKSTETAPARVVETLAATATQILPTDTPLPPSATPRPPTEIVKSPTASQTATDRIKPTEKPLPGELFSLDCTEMPSWAECQKQIDIQLSPLLQQQNWGTTINPKRTSEITHIGLPDGDRRWLRELYYDPETLGSFRLRWKRPSGIITNDEGIVFGVRSSKGRRVLPVLPVSPYGSSNDNVGLFWSAGPVNRYGIPMSPNTMLSGELMKFLFGREKKIKLRVIELPISPINFKFDATTAFLLEQTDEDLTDGVEPLRLVDVIGYEEIE